MTTLQESRLQFTFPEDWIVKRFDTTPAYRSLSGHGLKGVDFISLTPDDGIWLIEVKNYRGWGGQAATVAPIDPCILAEQCYQKFADSERLIDLVYRAMQKKWWGRIKLLTYRLFTRPRPSSPHWFWNEAARRLAGRDQVGWLAWLEGLDETERAKCSDELFARCPGRRVSVACTCAARPDIPNFVGRPAQLPLSVTTMPE